MLLSVNNLTVGFPTEAGLVKAVNGVSFDLEPRESLAIVGESGSGKTVSMLAMLRLLPTPPAQIHGGPVRFEGEDLLDASETVLRRVRGGKIGFVFQDPLSSLNPVMPVGRQIGESIELHLGLDSKAAEIRTMELLRVVGIPDAKTRLGAYPHQFSGGMRQRVMIAMALACSPALLIADEPTTALDVTIQAQIIDLVRRLQRELGMAMIWITHDLGVVARIASRVIVMYAGRVMEEAQAATLFEHPRHPYTIGLLRSVPRVDRPPEGKLWSISGFPPNLVNYPAGCAFAERCPYRIDACVTAVPPLRSIGEKHSIACIRDVTSE